MRSTLFIASLAILVAGAGAASAQNATGTTGMSTATNSVTVNASTGTGSGDGSGSGQPSTSNVHYSGHEYSTPSVQGSYFAGANPCLVGVGASGAGGPIGLSFTFGRSDDGCQRRSDAAAWHALGHDDVAIARMCQDDDNHAAFEAVGYVCPQLRPKTAALAAPAAQAPVAAIVPPVAIMPAPPPAPAKVTMASEQPSWCETVTGAAERARYKQACAF